jgi:hypothetical protein
MQSKDTGTKIVGTYVGEVKQGNPGEIAKGLVILIWQIVDVWVS